MSLLWPPRPRYEDGGVSGRVHNLWCISCTVMSAASVGVLGCGAVLRARDKQERRRRPIEEAAERQNNIEGGEGGVSRELESI